MTTINAPLPTDTIDKGDALARLRDLISERGLVAGDRLPPERALIEGLGVTRTSLRNALERLENEGLIWRHVGKGTFIADPSDREPMAPAMSVFKEQLTPMRVMRARLCIEPALAREAAINASAQAINRLKHEQDLARRATSWEQYEAQDDRVHRAVAEASDNILLVSVFDRLNDVRRAVGWSQVVRATARPDPTHGSFAEHERLIDAIQDRDPAAAQEAMRAHIVSVSSRIFGDL